jgi:hypothetical protein
MRNSLVTTVICSAFFLSLANTAYSQNPPWCAIEDNNGTMQCNFSSEQQCLQTISGIGGRCILNPAGNSPSPGQRAPLFAPLLQFQPQDPGPPPGLGAVPPPPNN